MAVHKLTPALMVGSLLLGVVLAVGHHLYYNFLDGKIVESQTQQEWFFRVGTGLAFLARAMLSASVGFAYTQLLWRTLKSKPITIQGVNAVFGILDNAWDFTTWELWTAVPTLAVVAAIAWALPLIAVITPATLTVQASPQPNETVINSPIPVLDYLNTANYAQWTETGGTGYTAPSSAMSRVLLSVASMGSIMTIPAPSTNSSYSAEFYGPSISCGTPKNESFAKIVSETVANATCCGNSIGYVGFAPSYRVGTSYASTNATEEDYALMGLQGVLNTTLIASMPSFDETAKNTSSAKFYVVVPVIAEGISYIMANKTIECQLYNSSYATNFTFRNGQQDITFKSRKLNPVSASNAVYCQYEDVNACRPYIAYVSLVDALGKLLMGQLSISHYGVMSPIQTQIMSSVLMDAKEMQSLKSVGSVSSMNASQSVIGNISMAHALEQVFENATMSLFSNSNFLQNDTAASDGPVTILSAQNSYSYEPRNLFIAYGLGILVCAVLVIIGLICIRSASASYGSSFSTIMRTTRNPDLDSIVQAAETSGAEPLSNRLANTSLLLRRQTRKLDGNDEHEVTFFAVHSMEPDEVTGLRRVPSVDSLLQHDGDIQLSTARN